MPIIDLHCDTLPALAGRPAAALRKNELQVDLSKMQAGEVALQVFAIYLDLQREVIPYARCLEILQWFHSRLPEWRGELSLVRTAADVCRVGEDGIPGAMLSIEDGGILEGNLDHLPTVYEMGVRAITLTWNYPNALGRPNYHWIHQEDGLTALGCQMVEEMQRLGMVVDVSHLSDQGFLDVAALAKRPFIASHSNVRSVTGHWRNLSDEMIRLLAERGGVMGFALVPDFLATNGQAGLAALVQHIRQAYRCGGCDVLALGSDFDGTDGRLEISDSSRWQVLAEHLHGAGFTAGEVDKICWQNAKRVLLDCL